MTMVKVKMLRRTLQGRDVVGVNEPLTTTAPHAKELIRKGYAVEWDGADDADTALEDMQVPALKDLARQMEIDGYANLRKAELIERIEAVRADGAVEE